MRIAPPAVLVIAALTLAVWAGAVRAQDDAPTDAAQAAGRRGAGGLGGGADGTRVFLGLGPKPDLAAATRGQPLFGANCGGCHGADGRGGAGGPNLLYANAVITDVSGSNVAAVIHDGRGAMPAFAAKLSDTQIADIASYLDQLVEYVANRGTYTYQNVLVGDAQKGQADFATDCAACHSPTGDLAGIATRNKTPQDLQHAWIAPRGPAQTVTVTLPGQPPITGTLQRKSDFAVMLTTAGGANQTIDLTPATKVQTHDVMTPHAALVARISDDTMHDITAYLETLK